MMMPLRIPSPKTNSLPKKQADFAECRKLRRSLTPECHISAVQQFGTALAVLSLTCIKQGDALKFIIAIIKPFKLDDVREALNEIGVSGMTVSEVKGFGRQKGQTEIYRGAEYSTNMVPKIKIEVACANDIADRVVEAVQQSANTGAIGDGKIFVFDLGQAVRIRTGETDSVAL
jgi:nitrogen regulatory protein P-II 2